MDLAGKLMGLFKPSESMKELYKSTDRQFFGGRLPGGAQKPGFLDAIPNIPRNRQYATPIQMPGTYQQGQFGVDSFGIPDYIPNRLSQYAERSPYYRPDFADDTNHPLYGFFQAKQKEMLPQGPGPGPKQGPRSIPEQIEDLKRQYPERYAPHLIPGVPTSPELMRLSGAI